MEDTQDPPARNAGRRESGFRTPWKCRAGLSAWLRAAGRDATAAGCARGDWGVTVVAPDRKQHRSSIDPCTHPRRLASRGTLASLDAKGACKWTQGQNLPSINSNSIGTRRRFGDPRVHAAGVHEVEAGDSPCTLSSAAGASGPVSCWRRARVHPCRSRCGVRNRMVSIRNPLRRMPARSSRLPV